MVFGYCAVTETRFCNWAVQPVQFSQAGLHLLRSHAVKLFPDSIKSLLARDKPVERLLVLSPILQFYRTECVYIEPNQTEC